MPPPPPALGVESARAYPDATWGWITLGSGVAVAAAAIPFTIMAFNDYDEMKPFQYEAASDEADNRYDSLNDSMKTKQIVAGVLYGVGGAAIVTGAVLLILDASVADSADSGTIAEGSWRPDVVGLAPLPGGGVLGLGWRF